MALDVGELVARLTLDDSRFTAGAQRAEQASRRIGDAATDAARRVQQATQDQSRSYQAVARELERNERAAQQARERSATAAEVQQRAEERLREAQRNSAATAEDIATAERQAEQARKDAMRAADRAQAAMDAYEASQRRAAAAARDLEEAQRRASQAAQDLDQDLDSVGEGGGENAGKNFLSGFADAIGDLGGKAGPIAGSLLGVAAIGLAAGAALAGAIKDGMEAELQRDMFQAQTGVTVAQARKFAQAAGEAYANVFGESVEENLSVAKLGLHYGFLDPGATQRDAEHVIQTLQGISAIAETEAAESARAIGGLINSGLVENFDEAADLITAASQAGLNRQGDLIDSLSEYAAGWKNTGLGAQTALALIDQSMDLGVDNTDRAADAIREFGRRVTEEGETIVEALNDIGLNGEEMYEAFKRGGEDAEDAFDRAFDAIREIEDPVERNTAAMALLGDTAGDFIGAFTQWDPSEARKKFGEVEGAAKSAIEVMQGNAATSVEGATRAISLAADGLKAALAEAFGPYIQQFADAISNNRAGVIQFFIDVGNAAFEGAEKVLQFVSGGMRGFAEFAQAGADMTATFLDSVAQLVGGLDAMMGPFDELIPGLPDFGKTASDIAKFADAARDSGSSIADAMTSGADAIDNTLIPALQTGQDRFNEFAGNMKLSAAFNDQIQKVNDAITDFGVNLDGSYVKLENWTGRLDRSNAAQKKMHDTLMAMPDAFEAQVRTGLEAGATVEELTRQYEANRDELIGQAMQMGLTNKEALELINSYGLVPELVETQISQPGMPEAKRELDVLKDKVIDVPDSKTIHTEALTQDAMDDLQALGLKVETLPDGTVYVTADTDEGQALIDGFVARNDGRVVDVYVEIQARRRAGGVADDFVGPTIYDAGMADGGVRQRANGALDSAHIAPGRGRGKLARSPLGPVRYAEGETEWEAFIPGAKSKRARAEKILAEVAKRFGFGLVKFDDIIASEAQKVFKGDPSSLTDQTDPIGWRALLGGDFSGRMTRVGLQEDSPIVDILFGVRNMLAEGDYDGSLAKYGIQEDNPLVDLLLRVNERLFPQMADGGIIETAGFDAQAAVAKAMAHDGQPYVYGGLDCSGYLSAVFNAGTGQNVRFTTDSDFEAMGWKPGFDPDGFSIGTNKGSGVNGHMTGYLYGTNIESDGSNGIQYGRSADSPLDFPYVYHWPGASALGNPQREAVEDSLIDQLNSGQTKRRPKDAAVTSTGVVVSTDGQRVFVTNWPDSLGVKSEEKPAEERQPLFQATVRAFDQGGLYEPHIAADGADLIRYAEPGTGGEAYIPLGPAKRGRSIKLTREVANRFGFELVPMQDGGLTGFGGYGGRGAATFDVPLTAEGWAAMSPNKRRATMSSLAALGIGGAFAIASGFDENGRFTGQFDTGANSHPFLEKALSDWTAQITEQLEAIRKAAENPDPVEVQVDIDRGSGTANIQIMKAGM